jgi:hypothetical protein
MPVLDETLQTMSAVFDFMALVEIEQLCQSVGTDEDREVAMLSLDKDNLEGIRVCTGNGGFFMLQKNRHDPVVLLQVEGISPDQVCAYAGR